MHVNSAAPELVNEGFSTVVTSLNGVTVIPERALYWLNMRGGTSSTGIVLP